MKLFVLCLLFSFCSFVGAQSDLKHPLVIVDGDSVNIDVLLFLDFAKTHQDSMDDRTLLRMRIAGIDSGKKKDSFAFVGVEIKNNNAPNTTKRIKAK